MMLERHEAKYVIPPGMVGPIRDYLRPFCSPDPHGQGDPPHYTVITLQLDGPGLPLHHAKRDESDERFKLRVRTYAQPDSPVFLEVKRKHGQIVAKSRAVIPAAAWCRDLVYSTHVSLPFAKEKDYEGFLTFVRLARELQAEPVVRIRYERESYFGNNEPYARVSFDRRIEYQPATDWEVRSTDGRWIPMDTGLVQNKLYPWSGVVLELKTFNDAPRWMMDLTEEFDLVRDGHCKYSNAVLSEAIFKGSPETPAYETVLQDY
jgi:hypothetical protein